MSKFTATLALAATAGIGSLVSAAAAGEDSSSTLGYAPDTCWKKVVIISDSLSDNGNAYRLNNYTAPQSPPYDDGRFSSTS